MNIAIDAMGGDNAPIEIVAGACDALKRNDQIEKIILVGDTQTITPLIDNAVRDRIEIVQSDDIIGMDKHIARKRTHRSVWLLAWSKKAGQTRLFQLAVLARN